jgi:hypothetical protein
MDCCKITEIPYKPKRQAYQTCKVCNVKKLMKEFHKIFKLRKEILPYRSMCKSCQEVWADGKKQLFAPMHQVVDEMFVVTMD